MTSLVPISFLTELDALVWGDTPRERIPVETQRQAAINAGLDPDTIDMTPATLPEIDERAERRRAEERERREAERVAWANRDRSEFLRWQADERARIKLERAAATRMNKERAQSRAVAPGVYPTQNGTFRAVARAFAEGKKAMVTIGRFETLADAVAARDSWIEGRKSVQRKADAA